MQYVEVREWLKDMRKVERDHIRSTAYIDLNASGIYETNKKYSLFILLYPLTETLVDLVQHSV
jgi:hypothetical protein